MDVGFLCASQEDYKCPDKSKDHLVTSFDGYNSYLIVVDKSTKHAWKYHCVFKETPLLLINLHLDQFGRKSGYIHMDQGGELTRCADFMTQMAEHHFIVEPTNADSPEQNKQAKKYNDIFGVTI